jgi:hypothetical protein
MMVKKKNKLKSDSQDCAIAMARYRDKTDRTISSDELKRRCKLSVRR